MLLALIGLFAEGFVYLWREERIMLICGGLMESEIRGRLLSFISLCISLSTF
jgi:hypothetical protein